MGDRVVRVNMALGIQQYIANSAKVRQETEKTRDAVAAVNSRLAAQREVMETTGRAGIAFGTLVAAGVALAVKKYADFDQAMSNVIATGDDARDNQDALRQAAIDAGAATVFSATESANAIEELAKAGVSAKDILAGGLDAALNLAAAGGLEVADAANIMATAMNQFGIQGRDATHVADLLAAGAGKAQGDVADMAAALNQAGLVAESTGLSIEETTGGLAAFAAAGLLGSDAGTSFKAMLQRLTPQSAEAQAKMDELGISAYDAQGNFVGLANFAGNLQTALHDLTPEQRNSALATIFGSDAVRAATILYNNGAEGIRDWTDAVDDQGYAAEVARTRLDNLKGDIEQLGGAFDSALIQSGSAANDVLRDMVQAITGLLDLYNELPAPIQATVLAVAGIAATVALSGGAALVAVPKFIAFKAAVAESGISLTRTALTAGVAGLALGGLLAIVAELARQQADARAAAQAYATTLESGSNKVTDATRKMASEALSANRVVLGIFDNGSAYDAAEKLGIGLDLVTDAATRVPGAYAKLQAAIAGADDGTRDYANAATVVMDAVNAQTGALQRATEVNEQKTDAEAAATESTQSAAQAYLDAADQVGSLNSQLTDLIDNVNKSNDAGQDAITGNIAYQDALAGVDEYIQKARDGVEGYSLTLDQTTQAGRDNLGMLTELADKAQTAAAGQLALDGNTDSYIATLQSSRDSLIQRAIDMGYSADQASAYADQVLRIPTQAETQVILETTEAQRRLADFKASLEAFQGSTYGVNVAAYVRQVGGMADGGQVRGPGTGTSDSILARLSNGEHVIKATAAQRHRRLLEWINAGGVVPGFAGGGEVRPQYSPQTIRLDAGSLPASDTGPTVSIGTAVAMDTRQLARDIVKEQNRQIALTGALRRRP